MLKFYRVKADFFETDKEYAFNIFLYDTRRDQRVVTLKPNVELTAEIKEEWLVLESKGAYYQIFIDNLKEFYHQTQVSESELLALNDFYFRMYDLQQDRLKLYEEKSKETFLLRSTLKDIAKTNNFQPLIDKVRAEILCFPLYESELISISTELVDKLFKRDIMPVRVAALAYMLAKQNKITDREQLCVITISSLLKDVGFGLIRSGLLSNFKDIVQEDIYLKHPMLSIYVLSKAGFEFDKQVKRIILEQHEQSDGSGFPRGKKEDYVNYLSYIVNLCDQILMYSSGKINGRETDLIKTIELFHKGVSAEGINVNFPHRLLESLGTLLLNDLEKELEKKEGHL